MVRFAFCEQKKEIGKVNDQFQKGSLLLHHLLL